MVIINFLCIFIIYYILIRKSAKNVLGLGFLKCEYEVFQKFSESKQTTRQNKTFENVTLDCGNVSNSFLACDRTND